LRPFVHEGEDYFYNKIHNVLCRAFAFGPFRKAAGAKHRQFNDPDLPIQMSFNGFNIMSLDGLDTWLYGDKYHFDRDKAARLERWSNLLGNELLVVGFLHVFEVRVRCIGWLADSAEAILEAFDAGADSGPD
ncbi:MAG: hypothetical protein ACQEVA_15785, partial [Myxococcota bacterium]